MRSKHGYQATANDEPHRPLPLAHTPRRIQTTMPSPQRTMPPLRPTHQLPGQPQHTQQFRTRPLPPVHHTPTPRVRHQQPPSIALELQPGKTSRRITNTAGTAMGESRLVKYVAHQQHSPTCEVRIALSHNSIQGGGVESRHTQVRSKRALLCSFSRKPLQLTPITHVTHCATTTFANEICCVAMGYTRPRG